MNGSVDAPKRTKVVKANLNPVWNEVIVLSNVRPNDRVSVKVCDTDVSFMGKESFTDIGQVYVSMSDIIRLVASSASNDSYFPLGGQKAGGEVGFVR